MDLLNELRMIVAEDQVTANQTVLEQHSRDESYHSPRLPDVVVFAKTKEDVSKVMAFANTHNIPVVPFGLGTSLEGHVIPYRGGISIDFQLMNQIIEVRPKDLLVRVQPGVTRSQLNKELSKYGLFFSVDPGADATLGGMAATNASGTTAVRYGVMRDQVRDLEAVLADGRIIHTGGLSAKSSAGYNITGLFVGSEGTLGLFTELTLRVYGIPEATMAARATFPSVKNAVDAAVSIISTGIPVARIELVDALSVKQVNMHSKTNYAELPTLFVEFHGNEAGLQHDVALAKELAMDEDCAGFQFESDIKSQTQLWAARHNLAYAFIHAAPGKRLMSTDVCVPLTELTNAVENSRHILDEFGMDGGILGHIGDGNYHVVLMIDTNDPEDVKRAEAINERIVEYALARGGTCTGEHGVGAGKIKYLRQERGEALDVITSIKNALDPKGILNPGKIIL